MPKQLDTSMLSHALIGYEIEREKITTKIGEIKSLLDGARAVAPRKAPKRRITAAGRANIVAALKRR